MYTIFFLVLIRKEAGTSKLDWIYLYKIPLDDSSIWHLHNLYRLGRPSSNTFWRHSFCDERGREKKMKRESVIIDKAAYYRSVQLDE